MEAEKTDLRRQLAEERREANQAIAEAQAAQAEAKVARAESSLAGQRVEELEARFNALRGRMDKAEASTRSEVERTHAQFVGAYRELGARTADFEVPDREAGLRFLEWMLEELVVLPTIVEGFMSFASLITCEGAMNVLSREGCRHYEVFDQSDENFEREIFKVDDPVVKQSGGALFDRMWGPHGREAVRERSDRAREQMERAEDVEDFGALAGVPPEAAEVKPVLPSDAGEGPSLVPEPAVFEEGPASAAAPSVGGALEMVAEPAVEDPMATPASSQVAK